MHIRTISLIAVLVVIVAACSPGTAGDTTTTSTSAPTTTTTTEPVAQLPEAVVLSYTLEPGATFSYEVVLDQHIDMTTTGDPAAMGEEGLPGEMSFDVQGTSTFSQTVADGPEPGTYEVTIRGDFSDLEVSGTIDGTPVNQAEMPDMAEIPPVDVTVIVDEQGKIIPSDDEFGDILGGDFGAFSDFASPTMDPGRFIGPPFADREVGLGDSWSETVETPLFLDEDPITTEIKSVVTDTDTIDGTPVFVIETTSTTSMIELDFAEFLIGFFEAFLPPDASEEDRAQLEKLKADLRFLFIIDETVSDMTTRFDPEAGYALEADFQSTTHMVMDINMPDEQTGELVAFGMDMNLSQMVTYRLLDASDA